MPFARVRGEETFGHVAYAASEALLLVWVSALPMVGLVVAFTGR
jgi:hypothetical protein